MSGTLLSLAQESTTYTISVLYISYLSLYVVYVNQILNKNHTFSPILFLSFLRMSFIFASHHFLVHNDATNENVNKQQRKKRRKKNAQNGSLRDELRVMSYELFSNSKLKLDYLYK